jgi:dTDP-glucose 4,6-dehydratase
MNFLVTGGYGFIGSHFCHLLAKKEHNIVIIDLLTYAANSRNLDNIQHIFYHGNIGGKELIKNILDNHQIDVVVNFAAETHVDNSISQPNVFFETNVIATMNLLEICTEYQNNINKNFKFIHISTDEVFGDLQIDEPKFNENSRYNPSSPYAASKAASDHLVRAWVRTYNLNAIITNCSNNYGLYQHSEKLIPKTIHSCINKQPIIVYGNGQNIRDWIYADDHCIGIYLAIEKFNKGESYCFGGDCELTNLEVITKICNIFQNLDGFDYKSLIKFVEDRKGHDFRYAIDSKKAKEELGFTNYEGVDFDRNLKYIIDTLSHNN